MCHYKVRRVGPVAERAPAPVDKTGRHAKRLGADAIEGVVSDEQDLVWRQADDLGGSAIGRHMRLESARTGDREQALERKTDVWLGCLEHVGVAIREHDEPVVRGE